MPWLQQSMHIPLVVLRICKVGSCQFFHQSAHNALPTLRPLSADTGFGVGHTRDTQTKGVWLWGETQSVAEGGGRNRTVRAPAACRWMV